MSSPDDPNVDLGFGATLRGFNAGQRLFDRYALKEILGRGGMGIVWRAFDEQLERDVALKFLPELVAFDEQAVADLKRETKKSQELRHHHIVQVYDFVTDKQNACIAMEYVDGPTLSAIKARKENGFLEVDEITQWVEQLCEALAYAHQRARVVHRDLKPANLMINGKSELKVTDFGIARSVSDSVSMLTMARGTSGTLVYMSPQQLAGQRASHLDDIYSVGVSIYELLTSKPPFYSGDVTDQIKNAASITMQKRREDLEIVGFPIPREWEETVAACLAKDPARRPQSAGDVAKRLGLAAPWYVKPVEVGAIDRNRSVSDRTTQVGRNRKAALVAALAALVLIGGAAGWYFGSYLPKEAARKAKETAAVAERSDTAAKASAVQPGETPAKTETLTEAASPNKQAEEISTATPSASTSPAIATEATTASTSPQPTLSPTKRSFAGTWKGTVRGKSSGGGSDVQECTLRISDDEKTVWTEMRDVVNAGNYKSSCTRDGDILTWSLEPKSAGISAWTCTLKLKGNNTGTFTDVVKFKGGGANQGTGTLSTTGSITDRAPTQPPVQKKLFAGTWTGTINATYSLNGLQRKVFKITLSVDDSETRLTDKTSDGRTGDFTLPTVYSRKGRTLSASSNFAARSTSTFTVSDDGKTASCSFLMTYSDSGGTPGRTEGHATLHRVK